MALLTIDYLATMLDTTSLAASGRLQVGWILAINAKIVLLVNMCSSLTVIANFEPKLLGFCAV